MILRTNNAELQRALAAHSESLKILAMPLNELRKRLTDTRTKPGIDFIFLYLCCIKL